ncbi:MAG: tetratricopeptide repeat protein [Balneolales bacterium]
MKLRKIKYLVAFLMLATITTQVADAQTREDVVLKFNEGFELVQSGDDLAAIETFEETLELAEAVGAEADDIRDRVRSQIPQLYFRHAASLYQGGDIDSAIEAFQETVQYAEQYGDENTKARAEGNLPRLYLSMGNNLYRNGEHDAALGAYNNALDLNANYPLAIYQKGLVYRQKEDLNNALEQFDLAIDISLNAGDMDMADRASDAAKDYLVYLGANAIEDENFSAALELLNQASTYDGSSAEVSYRLAEAHNHLGNWDQAIANANQALEYESDGRADQAKIWFELGIAYKNQENEPQACQAFQNASFGPFQANAEYELEHELNCAQASR